MAGLTKAQRYNKRMDKIWDEVYELERKKKLKECPICHKKFKDVQDKIAHAMFGCRR